MVWACWDSMKWLIGWRNAQESMSFGLVDRGASEENVEKLCHIGTWRLWVQRRKWQRTVVLGQILLKIRPVDNCGCYQIPSVFWSKSRKSNDYDDEDDWWVQSVCNKYLRYFKWPNKTQWNHYETQITNVEKRSGLTEVFHSFYPTALAT